MAKCAREGCEHQVITGGTRKYCSRTCYGLARTASKLTSRVCLGCGVTFYRLVSRPTMFHSLNCFARSLSPSDGRGTKAECVNCSSMFVRPAAHARFCKIACAQENQRQPTTRQCLFCGTSFTCLPSSRRTYCNHNCAMQRKITPPKICVICGQPYKSHAKYFCSTTCAGVLSLISKQHRIPFREWTTNMIVVAKDILAMRKELKEHDPTGESDRVLSAHGA